MELPLYTAVIEWLPNARLGAVNEATPFGPSATVPRTAPPSLKVTVPVGTTVPTTGFTVAVNVTGSPTTTTVADDVSVTETPVALTCCVNVPDVAGWQFAFPLYTTEIGWLPTASPVV